MRTTRQALVFSIFLGLAGGLSGSSPCDPKDEKGKFEPYPEDTVALFCQESCQVNADCLAGTVCAGDCDVENDLACATPFRCVECKADADCTNPGARFCLAGVCGACAKDSQCPATAPRCLPGRDALGRAGMGPAVCTCDASSQCAADEKCMHTTDSARPAGVPGCVCWDNSACAGLGPEICIAGICIACEFDAHCITSVGAGSKCKNGGAISARCTCLANADCPPLRPNCDDGTCVECVADADCPADSPLCVDNACVECRAAPRDGTTETQVEVDDDCQRIGFGKSCSDGKCSCAGVDECTFTPTNPNTNAVCE